MKLDSLYQDIILDHYKHPHRRGLREPYDAEVHHVNPTCGDEVTLRVKVADGVVEDVSYEGAGCSISQASTSVLTDLVVGKPVADAVAVLEGAVAFAGVSKYPSRVKCALLGWMAWKDATMLATAPGAGQDRAVAGEGTRA